MFVGLALTNPVASVGEQTSVHVASMPACSHVSVGRRKNSVVVRRPRSVTPFLSDPAALHHLFACLHAQQEDRYPKSRRQHRIRFIGGGHITGSCRWRCICSPAPFLSSWRQLCTPGLPQDSRDGRTLRPQLLRPPRHAPDTPLVNTWETGYARCTIGAK